VGLRGYLACRILSQNGFTCRNLSGGYKTYKAVTGMMSQDEPVRKEMTSDTGGASPAGEPGSGATGGLPASAVQVVRQVDARGLQCPGPIMQLKTEIDGIDTGKAVSIVAGDPAFARDIAAWCHSTGHKLLDVRPEGLYLRATVQKNGVCHTSIGCHGPAPLQGHASHAVPAINPKNKTMVVFSGDLDKALAAFIIANGAAAMGSHVTMFFTFWGINILRRPERVGVAKTIVERMFGWMMPRGAGRLTLSKMNMGGMGAAMIKGIMRRKNVLSLPEMIAAARQAGVRLVVCTMSMDLMGIQRAELIDGIEEGGVATYLDNAEAGNVNLFI
jgi:peroxiredoxin family protein/TusA-related sulfurtransferase